jgi:hypothetical protein
MSRIEWRFCNYGDQENGARRIQSNARTALAGKTPAGRMAELGDRTPLNEDVASAYDESKERMRYAEGAATARWPP